ncbi:MAG TPA: glycosyl hydrolase family 28 protein [Acidobacteriaceae bacterium]|nr:glycosyl hydrolase family 28 protein [Acidobacteriaceae bacterium]
MKAGLLAAGSAIGGPLLGCAESQTDIPCLGPAAAPTPVSGMSYIRASEIGCALDCDLGNGRNKYRHGAATDDGPRINAAMAGASAANPITFIIDGSALISGLFPPAGGYWSIAGLGCGTGFFVKSGTNNDGIHNGPPDAATTNSPGPPAPPRGKNVSLSNFTLNGNQGNGHDGVSTTGQPHGSDTVWYFGIHLMNLDNISIENLAVVDTPAFHIRLSNVGNVTVAGCVIRGEGINSDGIHVDGPANDIAISNCRIATEDDSIALNCPEGYSGNISRVAVTGSTFNSVSLMRLYTVLGSARFSIDTVTVSDCTGTLAGAAFLIGYVETGNPDAVASLSVSNCTLTAPVIFAVIENFGTLQAKNVTFFPSHFDWGKQSHACGFLRPPPPPNGLNAWTGSSLILQNCKIVRRESTDVAAIIFEQPSTIAILEFDGFAVQQAGFTDPATALLSLGAGSVEQLVLNSVDSTHIYDPVQAGEFIYIGTVAGTGVLATAWRFPDDVMADNVPYISATTGQPSIKVGGVVEAYSG